MKESILEYVKEKSGGVSFVELANNIPGFSGDYSIGVGKNIWYWFFMSEEAADALRELIDEGGIHLALSDILVYMVDGGIPNVPIAKRLREYKKPRWLPTVVNLGVRSG